MLSPALRDRVSAPTVVGDDEPSCGVGMLLVEDKVCGVEGDMDQSSGLG